MLQKTKGIVLHNIKYGDSSLIAHIYTCDFGRQAYMINGVRNKKGKFHFNQFQALTLLELEVDHKPNRELQRIKELHITHPFHHIHTDIVKNTIALFVGEVLYRCLTEVESNLSMYHYLESAIQLLDHCEKGSVNFHLIFLVQFTRFLGIFPENNMELGHFQSNESRVPIEQLLSYNLKDLDKLKIDNKTRNKLVNSMIEYYYYHLEGMSKISSIKVLHEIFN